MFKKLDKLILKSFLGPFIVTFFIALFVLFLQTAWKYIDDLVGKGLDLGTIGLFIFYMSATLLILAMPIAILISSIMTFGNLGESFELVAIKSSGISLLRFMRPLLFVAIVLSGITFLFANYVMPYANLKAEVLYKDILYTRPAFDLKEGIFYTQIPSYAIKVGKKESDNKTIRNVIIYEDANNLQDNIITADKGIMQISSDKKFLEFNLQNGYRYQERGNTLDSATEFIRLKFDTYKKLFDVSILQKQSTDDSLYRKNFRMLSVRQLNKSMDSLIKLKDTLNVKLKREQAFYFAYTKPPDSVLKKINIASLPKIKTVYNLLPDSLRYNINEAAISNITSLKSSIINSLTEKESRTREIRFHKIEWHRKFSLSMACIILFFIGAPLGSIIRKGGMGMPLVVAIIFFLLFHLLNTFGEKFVKEGSLTPITGMWLAIITLLPVGAFLTYKAMHDSQLFSKEFYTRIYKKVKPLFSFLAKKRNTFNNI
ncbi:MAG: LptF/LptG family permease [Ferruginibacter sp.]|nr:LptF/LptG family permease [Ferruginibacter sp.]